MSVVVGAGSMLGRIAGEQLWSLGPIQSDELDGWAFLEPQEPIRSLWVA